MPDSTNDAVVAADPVNANEELNVLNGKYLNIVIQYKYSLPTYLLYFCYFTGSHFPTGHADAANCVFAFIKHPHFSQRKFSFKNSQP